MDPELGQALERLEERMVGRIAGEIQASEGRMREYVGGEIQASEGRVREYVGGEIRASEGRMEARMREYVGGEIRASEGRMRQDLAATAEEIRRHTGVLIEGLRADFRIATEAFTPLGRSVEALKEDGERTKRRVDLLEGRVTVLERAGKPRRSRGR